MALASLQLTMNISGRDKVYVAALPFRATTEPFQSVTSALHALHLWDLQHFVVIIKTSSPPSNSKASLFHFQPEDPQNLFALALAALPGGSIPGTLLRRKLTRLPKQRCWFVGYSEEDSLDIVLKINDTWETDWRMGIHDCRNYANKLVERLTGEKYVLERLRRCTGWLI
ncbi:uncharacterized protein LOC115689527 [Syzygium oleosum]|uniref:uncharacterized protein LOC115689527 n=1 Tax=Syzygium oleosum TaxID=219896 RepID=UPI0011D1E55C|nr:uncharacterized protein LOC115689527 [Syzygium oleosum]XP_056162990.1 uncharacterized protein LOC115689527 [Syzygium oleosum]XP_056162991.1 uncharacterized protein LOC115689527 [Syzygium oleosum]